jgi:uncharacterized protein (TIGR03083 family)
MPPRPRPVALPQVLEAFSLQSQEILAWAEDLTPEELAAPSTLPAWSVGDVVAHLAISATMVPVVLGRPSSEAPLPLATYVTAYAAGADAIAEAAKGEGEDDPIGRLRANTAPAVDAFGASNGDDVVQGTRGPIRVADLGVTRVLELVAHSLDLGAPVAPEALALIVRTLVAILAEREPGHAVELRVPPYAAAQVLTGTRHRRGTPPAVVEIAPPDWVRIATGRLTWADAVADGRVRASGERSDLSPYLPLLS